MAIPKIGLEGQSIILVGHFNPMIFQPAWFAAQGLLTEGAAKAAIVEIIHQDIAEFTSEWLTVQVLRDKFTVTAIEAPGLETARDLVVGTFEILEHTPVTVLGMNSDRHYQMSTKEAWDQLGKRLAPVNPWGKSLTSPGLRSLMMEGQRSDDFKGVVRVTVQPSQKIEHGVYVQYNDHYDLREEGTEIETARPAVERIKSQWESFMKWPNVVAEAIFNGDSET